MQINPYGLDSHRWGSGGSSQQNTAHFYFPFLCDYLPITPLPRIDGAACARNPACMKTALPFASPVLPAALWVCAFVCALFPVNAWQIGFFFAAIALAFGWSALMLHRQAASGWTLPRTPVMVFAGLFWLLCFASLFWSGVKPASINAFCLFSLLPLTFFVGVIAGNDAFFKNTARALAVIFAILAVWAVIQFFFLNAYFYGQARHPLQDPSSLGALFSLALFCALGWVVSDRPAPERGIAAVLAFLLVCAIMSTVARGPVFAFLPGIVLFAALLWPQVAARRKILLLILAGALAFYGVMQAGAQGARPDLASRLAETVTGDFKAAANNRLDVWAGTLDMIRARPLLGTGIGTYFLYYPEFRHETERDGVYLAHSDPLQFWAELGVLGPLLFYAFALAAGWRSVRALRALKNAPPSSEGGRRRIIIVTTLAALVSMTVHSHVAFNHYNLSILLMTGLLLAAWMRETQSVLQSPHGTARMPANLPAAAQGLLIALPFLMLGWLLSGIALGEHYANRARDNLFREEMFAFADNINAANRVSNGLNHRAYIFAVNVPMAILENKPPGFTAAQEKELYAQVIGYMDAAEAINPRDPSSAYYRAKVQQLVGPGIVPKGTPTPESYYRQSLKLQPAHLGARLALLDIYKKKKAPPAQQLAMLEMGRNFTYATPLALEYYGEMANLYLEARDYDKAKEMMRRIHAFKKRSDFSAARQKTGLPQAMIGGDAALAAPQRALSTAAPRGM